MSSHSGRDTEKDHDEDSKRQARVSMHESVATSMTNVSPSPYSPSQPLSTTSDPNSGTTECYHSVPPPLNFTLRTDRRERYIIIFFTLLFVETGVLPLILFYSLRWGAHLSITANLAIITSLVGTVSGLKVTQRTFQLWFKSGHESRRPIGSGRWGVDAFHVLIGVAMTAFFVPLIIGSSLTPASPRTVALALPCLMLTFSVPLLLTGVFDRHIRLPVRVSSLPPNEVLPPLTYTIVEDIVAVDGGGGLAFRQAWRHRYEASRVMRRLLRVTAVVWGASGTVIAIILIVAAWTAPTDTAYGLGYGMPWLWAMLASAWTVHYVHEQLIVEARDWDGEAEEAGRRTAHKEVHLHLKEGELDREVDRLQRERTIQRMRSAVSDTVVDDVRTREREDGRPRSHVHTSDQSPIRPPMDTPQRVRSSGVRDGMYGSGTRRTPSGDETDSQMRERDRKDIGPAARVRTLLASRMSRSGLNGV